MAKVRYEIDPHNRLTRIGPDRFRTVIDGEFKLDDDNRLIYHVKKSDNIDVPQQIKFSGNWSLDKEHNLIFTLDKWNNQCEGNKLVLKGDLVTANRDELVFSIETRNLTEVQRVYILSFNGCWQADKYNRLIFNVTKEQGSTDQLTLQGVWEINKQNEIVYTCVRTQLKTKERIKNTIVLRGHWDISKKTRLSYCISDDIGSCLDFKAAFEKTAKDYLRYGISIGYAAKKASVSLYGRWTIDKECNVVFEITYADESVKLESKLSKTFLEGKGEAFVKALVSREEAAVMVGGGIRW